MGFGGSVGPDLAVDGVAEEDGREGGGERDDDLLEHDGLLDDGMYLSL